MPFGADNALIKAAEVVRRLGRPTGRSAKITDMWKAQVAAMPLPDEIRAGLLDPARIWETIETLPPPLARTCHAATHTTISPNVVHGGQKTNIIPDAVELDVDIRTVPGTTHADVDAMLHDALGELAHHVTWSDIQSDDPTESPRGNALWDAVANATQVAYPGAELLPGLVVGGTDARFFRAQGRRRLRRRAVLPERHAGVVRHPLPRQRRAHRRRVARPRRRLLDPHRQGDLRLTTSGGRAARRWGR